MEGFHGYNVSENCLSKTDFFNSKQPLENVDNPANEHIYNPTNNPTSDPPTKRDKNIVRSLWYTMSAGPGTGALVIIAATTGGCLINKSPFLLLLLHILLSINDSNKTTTTTINKQQRRPT